MKYTRFEKARIIGARALQISFGAPVLVDYPADMLDPIDIAMLEYEKDFFVFFTGYVVRIQATSKSSGFGLKFLDLTEDQKSVITSLLE